MKTSLFVSAFATAMLVCATANADLIFDTSPVNNQANLTAAAAQTFTTPGDLMGEEFLETITAYGPSSTAGNFTYALEIFTDIDQDFQTWDPGTSLGESGVLTIGIGQNGTFDFSSQNIKLDTNTVYGILYTDGSGNATSPRIGLQGGNTGLGASTGTLFSVGNEVFGGGFDASLEITTAIPEPSTIGVLALLGIGFVRRRRAC